MALALALISNEYKWDCEMLDVCVVLCMLGLTAEELDQLGLGGLLPYYSNVIFHLCLFFLLFFKAVAARAEPLIVYAAFRDLVLLTGPNRSNCYSAIVWEDI